MPRYHFHVLDGTSYIDDAGTELASIEEAKREARRYAGNLLADSAMRSSPDHEWRVEVADNLGDVLFRLAVSMTDVP